MVVLKNDFYKRYCRVCGSNDGITVDLFTDEGKSYLTKVQKLLNIEISETDQLPKNICHMCISFVSDFNKFINQCKTVQIKLSDLASRLTQNPEEKEVVESSKRQTEDTVLTKIIKTETRSNVRNDQSKKVRPANNDLNKCIEIQNKEPIIVNLIDDPDPDIVNLIDNPNKLKSKPEPDITENWTIQTLPTNNTKLYICNKCPEMLLCESAIRSHQCNTAAVPKAAKIISSDQLLPPENDDMKIKRRRILHAPED